MFRSKVKIFWHRFTIGVGHLDVWPNCSGLGYVSVASSRLWIPQYLLLIGPFSAAAPFTTISAERYDLEVVQETLGLHYQM